MADLTYSAELKDGISPGLKKIQSELKTTQDVFSKFQNVISGLAVGAFITNAFRMADAISDTAKAAGVSTQALLGFTNAIAANGGTVDGAQQGILKFNQSIADAANGSRETQAAFAKVGVSLNDLRTLSEEDLMRKTVDGLGRTSDASQRAGISMDLFGRAAKGTDFVGVAKDIDALTEAQRKNAAAVESAGAVSDSLSATYRELQIQILNALKPLADLAKMILDNRQAVAVFLETVVNLVAALGSLFLINKVTSAFASFTNELSKNGSIFKSLMGMIGSGAALTSAQAGVKNLKIEWMELGNVFSTTGKGIEASSGPLSKLMSFIGGVGKAFVRFLPIIGQVVSAFLVLDGVVKLLTGNSIVAWADKAGKAISDVLGISYKTSEQKDKEAAAIDKATEAQEKQKDAAQETRAVVDTIGIAYKALVADLQKGVDAYMRSNDEVLKRLKLDGELIGLTEQQKAVKQALFDVDSKNQAELIRLQELYKEKSTSSKEEDLRLLPDIQKAMEKVKGSLEGQKKAVEDLVVANAARLEQENQLKALAEFTSSTQISNAKALRDLQHEMATSTMSAVEKKYADIARAADESARAEIEKENSRRRQLGLIAMTADEEAKYYAASKQGIDKLGAAHKKSYEQSRTWSAGWNKAWREYADDATNAAKTAESIFKKTTSGIEDAIVGLVKTGKFEWKSLLGSIAEEMLRSGIRKGITGLFEGLSGGGDSLLGSLGKMLGMEGVFGGGGGAGQGASANNPIYVYDIAGGGARGGGGGMGGGTQQQSGGGWWDQVTDTVSTVWDGITGAASSVWDTVTGAVGDLFGGGGDSSWLGDLASGIGSLFGGFFANGGTLGAGKFGIAGENGPEMISGPATITPMGGSTNVTYNINAVDAMSFKQMIAADPSFIHAVAQQGGKSVPRRY